MCVCVCTVCDRLHAGCAGVGGIVCAGGGMGGLVGRCHLILGGDGRRVVQDEQVHLKDTSCARLQAWVKQDHALADLGPPHFLQRKRCRLPSAHALLG